MQLTVAPKERRSVVLQIASMQAGYRGFGHAVSTTDLRLGQALEMRWWSLANSCTTGGGMHAKRRLVGNAARRWERLFELLAGAGQCCDRHTLDRQLADRWRNVTGNFTYTLMCVGQIPSDTTTVRAAINVTASSPPAGGSGAGGGGAFDGLALVILALARVLGTYRCRSM